MQNDVVSVADACPPAPSPSFNRRLAEAAHLDAIRALVEETLAAARNALRRKDRRAHGVAVARRMAARRKGGADVAC